MLETLNVCISIVYTYIHGVHVHTYSVSSVVHFIVYMHLSFIDMYTASSLLSPSLSEGCAHTLAAIHIQLRGREDLLPAYNCTFEYLAERSVHVRTNMMCMYM